MVRLDHLGHIMQPSTERQFDAVEPHRSPCPHSDKLFGHRLPFKAAVLVSISLIEPLARAIRSQILLTILGIEFHSLLVGKCAEVK
jgi:hypothetical protein